MTTADPQIPDPASLSALAGKKGCSVTTSGLLFCVVLLACAVWAVV